MGSQLIALGGRGSSELQGLHQHRWKMAFACRGLLQTSSKSGCGGLEVVTNSFPIWVEAAKVSHEAALSPCCFLAHFTQSWASLVGDQCTQTD